MSDLLVLPFSETVPYIDEHPGYASGHGGVHVDEMSAMIGVKRLSEFEPKLKF